MEILFRRFGKEGLESRVEAFMNADDDGDKSISFSEFLKMNAKTDPSVTSSDKEFRLSREIINTTRQERALLMRRLGVNPRPLSPKRGADAATPQP